MSRFLLLVLTLCLVLGTQPAEAADATTGAAPVASAAQPGSSAKASTQARQGKARWKRWTAPRGPHFNDPHLTKGHYRIERRIIQTIKHARKGSTIRIAVYSFDRMPVAKALIAAHKRGVKLQMLLNDHWDTPAMKAVRARIGTDRTSNSFIYKCKAGCRATRNEYNNMHSKFYSFSQAGRSKDVLAVGSHNLTRNADIHQWNDLYFTSGDHELFRQFVSLFNDMRKDYSTRQPARFFCGTPANGVACDDSVDKHTVWAFPKPSGPKNDVVLDVLRKVQCLTPTSSGGRTRTRLNLSMHTMRGKRGDYLASAIRQKHAEGCKVRVMYGLIGYHTKRVIGAPTKRGRIPLRSTGLDYNTEDNFDLNNDGKDDLILDYYSHQKYLTVQGTYNGVPDTHMVLTGSSNWASLSTGNDEVLMTVRGRKVVRKYVKNFDYQWRNKRNSRNAYTTTYANFRVQRTVRDADGSSRTVWVTERRPIVTIEPDNYRTGPYWEND
ncbi:phosphatidylserine/phosphatidylglycerophosphate/cardiolipin synthase-like enzyme [Nocardioides cavernae]|uniref:phospholipase D n=1 Tax=Nocardioides cavernae TaxID=1921566 RepID=A0A7Y9H582_9ACTN|nr:phospholipase D-like domain-containing protein [Nocardioides cavernae]NYE38117.1 phosphatidylserine/phosphatidylglycerophosphate/cardiolipin synthase-like enzyme [Nocardioides cavernae]